MYLTFLFFFFNHTATTEIYTLSLHDALPILQKLLEVVVPEVINPKLKDLSLQIGHRLKKTDRKSTRLNSSHLGISYAVFCLKKKKKKKKNYYKKDTNILTMRTTKTRDTTYRG